MMRKMIFQIKMQINSEEMDPQTNNKTYHRKSPLFENLKDEVHFSTSWFNSRIYVDFVFIQSELVLLE